MITQDELKKVLHYSPNSGIFTWVLNTSCRDVVGTRAGFYVDKYRCIGIYNNTYKEHRLAFLYMTGTWPKAQMDHINHIRDDNRWCNLQESTNQQNQRNSTRRINNTSGCTGVYWDTEKSRWMAYIYVDNRRKYLGRYKDKEDAIRARKEAEVKYGFHENHGKDGEDIAAAQFKKMKAAEQKKCLKRLGVEPGKNVEERVKQYLDNL